jgi:hypothetical protein
MKNPALANEVRKITAEIEQGHPNPENAAKLIAIGVGLLVADVRDVTDLRCKDERSQILNEANRQMVAHVDGQIDVLRREIAAERRPVRSWLRRLFSRFSWNTSDGS